MIMLRPSTAPLVPARSPEGWKAALADPEKHWNDGHSAKMLAEAREGGLPDLPSALRGSAFASFRPLVPVSEYKVILPGGAAHRRTTYTCSAASTRTWP